ncbi:MAG: selenide, water dikinase SelD [Ginsengibacter sp.]
MNDKDQVKGEEIRLTQYSRGAGCGCKISPEILDKILAGGAGFIDNNLLVGNSSKDDAAVLDLGNGTALISTTDFFMPIVDDAFTFGKIAAANSISDIYAMGGKPVLAIAILGWPVDKLSPDLAKKVTEGARAICLEAGISLAGGHSIDSPEPFFGLAVNGIVKIENLKRNDTAKEGDILFLTKPVGVGVFSTALKRNIIKDDHLRELITQLSTLNSIGEKLGQIPGVSAMTDVTGFGLAGHLIEMADGSGLSAELNYSRVILLDGIREYLSQRVVPDATYRNWNSYGKKIHFETDVNVMEAFSTLPDPQTNGGLLIAVNPDSIHEIEKLFKESGMEKFMTPIGKMIAKQEKSILVLK